MRVKQMAIAAVAAAAAMVAVPMMAASAPHGGRGGGGASASGVRSGGTGGMRSGGSVGRSVAPRGGERSGRMITNSSRYEHHRRRGGRVIYGLGPFYSYSDDDSCYWLKRRALQTGSRYWWRRYRDCID